jgi:hypothetical protein
MDGTTVGIIGGIILTVGLIGAAFYFDSKAAIPSPQEIMNLENALPDGCIATDIGSYGTIDNMVIIVCDGRHVDASYTYMHQSHGKTSETDRSAVFVIR